MHAARRAGQRAIVPKGDPKAVCLSASDYDENSSYDSFKKVPRVVLKLAYPIEHGYVHSINISTFLPPPSFSSLSPKKDLFSSCHILSQRET